MPVAAVSERAAAAQQAVADGCETSPEDQPRSHHQPVGTGQLRVPPLWHDLFFIPRQQERPAECMACAAAVMMVWSGLPQICVPCSEIFASLRCEGPA